MTTDVNPPDGDTRTSIGKSVITYGLVATALLGVVAMLVAILGDVKDGQTRFNYVKDILAILLPLIGTWVGTILAFYFSRENFNSAAQQTAALVRQLGPDQRLQSIPVTDVMIDMGAATTLTLVLAAPTDAKAKKLKADVIDGLFDAKSRNRLPIVDGQGRVQYVVHRSYVDKFLIAKVAGGVALADVTLDDLLSDATLKPIFESFAVVGKEAHLFAVKQAMDGNPNCADAFVTEDGTKGAKAIGWITNAILREKSTA